MGKLLEVNNLSISFTQYVQGLNRHDTKVISDLTIDVGESEIVAVLGSSGQTSPSRTKSTSFPDDVWRGSLLASFGPVPAQDIPQPYAAGWNELFDILLK